MKPKIPIEVWSVPPDPIDGLLSPPTAPKSSPLPSSPAGRVETTAPPPSSNRAASGDVAPGPKGTGPARAEAPPAERIHVTVYLEPEDLGRLRAEQRRREQQSRRPMRGVTDASAIVRDLIREHLS